MLKAWLLMPKFLRRRLLVGDVVSGPNGKPIRTLQYLEGGAMIKVGNRERRRRSTKL